MKRFTYIFAAFTALLFAACTQTIVFDGGLDTPVVVPNTNPDCQITYTTTDSQPITPRMSGIVSNTYAKGKGTIVFESPVETIDAEAFYGQSTLKSVELPQSVFTIGDNAFGSCSSLSSVKLNSELIHIGNHAFTFCTALTTVAIPDSVEEIGERAFYNCTALKTVTFGATSRDANSSNLGAIRECAFAGCASLTTITLPNKLISIFDDAFSDCTSLTTITIPDSVEDIGNNIFNSCSSLKEFKGKYATADSRSLVRDNILIAFAPAGLTQYTIDSSVTYIESHVFSGNDKLTAITLPEGLEGIGNYTFWECSALTTITIPAGVVSIGGSAFWECTSLVSVYCKPTYPPTLGNGGVFDDNKSGRKIYVPAESVETYKKAEYWSGYKSYIEAEEVEQLTIEQFLAKDVSDVWYKLVGTVTNTISTTYGNFTLVDNTGSVFVYGLTATKVDGNDKSFALLGLKDGDIVTLIGTRSEYNGEPQVSGAYYVSHETVEIPGTHKISYTSTDGKIVTPYQSDVFGANIISNTYQDNIGQIVFDGKVSQVGYDAFNGCTTLQSITLPEGVTQIGYRAFRGCSELVSVTLPNSITSFADHVFNSCEKLQSITIPASLTSCGYNAFYHCNSLEHVEVIDIANWCKIAFDSTFSNPIYYAKKFYNNGVEVTELNIPEGVTEVKEYAFYNCVPLTKVTIPSTVTAIGDFAFTNCKNIQRVDCKPTVPTSLGTSVFMYIDGSYYYTNCTIYVPAGSVSAYMSATGWSDYADRITSESNAPNVITYTSTDGKVVTPYKTDAFGATLLSNTYANGVGVMTFDSNVTKIGAFAFRDCKTLATISIPTTVTEIGNSAFNNCQGLENLTIPTSVTSIGIQAFYGCNSIESVRIPDSVTTIGEVAFGFCASLTEFKGKFASADGRCLIVDGTLNSFAYVDVTEYTLPNTVKTIGFYAMHNSAQLTSVTIPQSVTAINEGAFNGCISLESVYCKPTTTPAGAAGMFENNHPNRKIYVPSTVVNAYKSAQHWSTYADAIVADVNEANCQILYTSTDGEVVTPYKTDAFGANIVSNTYENGQGIITFDGEVTQIGANAFWCCTNISSITIPDSVTSIGYYAFQGCNNLTSVTIPESVTTIDANPFLDCKGLVEFNGKFASADKLCLVDDGAIISFAIGSGVTEYAIPDGVTTVKSSSFAGCSTLTTVTIPDSVTAIRGAAFSGCEKLAKVYCNPTTPPTGENNMFYNNATGRKIYVPAASVDAYKTAQYWSDYADAIEGIVAETAKIYYTSTDGAVVTPKNTDAFGVNILSNTYENGQGVITFDGDVIKIGSNAFDNCATLSSITIPESITELGHDAFIYCHSLAEVNIPQSVTTLQNNPFRDCDGLAKFTGKYASADGRMLVKDGTVHSFAPAGVTEYAIEDTNITTIGYILFWGCESLTKVTLPSSITKIDFEAFFNCTALKTVTCAAATPPTLGESAFDNNAARRKIYVPADSVEAYKTAAGWSTYADAIVAEGAVGMELSYTTKDGQPLDPYTTDGFGASFVENIYDASAGEGVLVFDGQVTTIPDNAFVACTNLTWIDIPTTITTIGANAFKSCNSVVSLTLPNSIATVGNYAFEGCTGKVTIDCAVASSRFNKAKFTEVIIGSSVNSIGNYAFQECTALQRATIPSSVTTIGASAFYGCTSLETIAIPDSVLNINNNAFYNCTALASVDLGNGVNVIGSNTFSVCSSLTEIVVPDSVTSIEYGAFDNCAALKKVTLGSNLSGISSNLFCGCTALESITIPGSATTIGSYSFKGCKKLTTVTISNGVAEIDNYAFYGCSALKSIDVPNSVTQINQSAFFECTALETVTIGNHVTNIGNDAFRKCSSLRSVALGSRVTEIGYQAFSECTALTSVTIPDSTITLGSSLFSGCTALQEVVIGAGVAELPQYFCSECTSLQNIVLPNNVESIDSYAFYYCTGLQTVNFGSVKTIGDSAFYNCTTLNDFTIPDSVTTIGSYTFYNCDNLTNITIGNGITSINYGLFYDCSNLTSVTIHDRVTSIGSSAFCSCSRLASVYCKPTTPPTGNYEMFASNASNRKIYVPTDSVDAYKAAQYWSDYADAIVAEDGSDEPVQQPGITPGGDIDENKYNGEL